jgi:hypothetical protein
MNSKFAVGDKVDQAFSNHAEGTVVAIFTDQAGDRRCAIEMFGHRYKSQPKAVSSRTEILRKPSL